MVSSGDAEIAAGLELIIRRNSGASRPGRTPGRCEYRDQEGSMSRSRFYRFRLPFMAALVALALSSCASDTDSDEEEDLSCGEPGAESECRCSEHVYGGRVCSDDEEWGECQCPFTSSIPPYPKDEFIPEPTGTCPGFVEGDDCESDDFSLVCTFHPEGLPPRTARVWTGETTAETDSMLVFFWHMFTGQSEMAAMEGGGVGMDFINSVTAEGGIFVSMDKSPDRPEVAPGDWVDVNNRLPWFRALGNGPDNDFIAMDEIVACAHEVLGVDFRRIHSTGFHAGGLNCGQSGHARSGYLASVACFGGGQLADPESQDPDNKYAAYLTYDGPEDWFVILFKASQEDFKARLDEAGHFAVICDTSTGTGNPYSSALQFLRDHPFGTMPSPYEGGFPEGFFSTCIR
jgi:hypothetical protein